MLAGGGSQYDQWLDFAVLTTATAALVMIGGRLYANVAT